MSDGKHRNSHDGSTEVRTTVDLQSLRRFERQLAGGDLEVHTAGDEEVYYVVNTSHDDPSEHIYSVFTSEEFGEDSVSVESVYCDCPHHKHRKKRCKHMERVATVVEELRENELQKKQDLEQHQREKKEAEEEPEETQREQEDEEELSEGAKAAQDLLDEARETREEMMSKSEWREMSSEGRARYVAML